MSETVTETENIRFAFDGEWAMSRGGGIAVYPRDDGTYSIGRRSGAREWRDVETGFANMQAAIDHADWMVTGVSGRLGLSADRAGGPADPNPVPGFGPDGRSSTGAGDKL